MTFVKGPPYVKLGANFSLAITVSRGLMVIFVVGRK
jgi:hypothetical protein